MALFTVTNLLDAGAGSLRDAIALANSMAGADTIEFSNSLSGGTIGLLSGELSITDSLTINGLGVDLLTVDAQMNGFRVFNINDGTASLIDVSINGLTITGGQAGGFSPPANDLNFGGGIFNQENLTLIESTISGNLADFGGGGIFNHNGGTVTLTNSTLSNNEAFNYGGGILNYSSMTLTNSTVSSNSSKNGGGGILNSSGEAIVINSTISKNNSLNGPGGGLANAFGNAILTVTNSTISDNNVSRILPSAAPLGSGIYNENILNLINTIIANNNSLNGDCVNRIGLISNNINNLIEDGSCNPLLSGDPHLGPLQNNGGPTETHALLPGSIAINAGSNAGVPLGVTTDQRGPGFARIANGTVDIGAFERQQIPESSSILGLLALFVLGSSLLLRQKFLQR